VDHLVIGPRGVFTVDSKSFTHPVSRGVGKGADLLWTGRSPIQLGPAKWETSVVSDLIGLPVLPFMCMLSPSLPEPVFDFDGVRICHPERLVTELKSATSGPIDVQQATDTARHAFNVEPEQRPSQTPARRRERPADSHGVVAAVRWLLAQAWFRLLAVIAGFFVLLSLLPVALAAFSSVVQDGTQRFIDGLGSTTVVETTPATVPGAIVAGPPAVAYEMSCPNPGMGWVVSFLWPGELPVGASSYAVRWQLDDRPVVLHTRQAWADPASGPADIRIPNNSSFMIWTEYLDDRGETLASTEQAFQSPRDC